MVGNLVVILLNAKLLVSVLFVCFHRYIFSIDINVNVIIDATITMALLEKMRAVIIGKERSCAEDKSTTSQQSLPVSILQGIHMMSQRMMLWEAAGLPSSLRPLFCNRASAALCKRPLADSLPITHGHRD